MYIQPPEMQFQKITYHKHKRKRMRHAKKKDVPPDYRKNRIANLKKQINEAKWQISLILEDIRKVMQHDY